MKFFWTLLCLLQLLRSTGAAFIFSLHIISHSTSDACDEDIITSCDTFFSSFCLRNSRSSQSTNTRDCPLGSNRVSFFTESGTVTISSTAAWKGGFQLFIEARDEDTISFSDHVDNIFIEKTITSRTGLSPQFTVTGSGNLVSITAQVELFCQVHYYGTNCNTFCAEADNNQDGHYTCDRSDGSPVCLLGYHNPASFCRENFDDCAAGPCQNGGTCTDLLADFECSCPPGYTGRDCSVDIDDCEAASCPGNSTCVDGRNSFTCRCHPGYEAENCTDFDDCSPGPCQNGGTCTDLLADFECSCPPGYTGRDCSVDTDDCEAASCPGNSTCLDGRNSFTCRCHPGYEGENCTDFDDCSPGPCQNGGTCTDLLADFECSCPPGYTGRDCSVDTDDCEAASCPGNSTCVDGRNSFTCRCHTGYEAENCTEVLPCASSPCHNGGTCMSSNRFSYNCLCNNGYSGSACEDVVDECLKVGCPSGMVCQKKIGFFRCTAQPLNNIPGGMKGVLIGCVVGAVFLFVLLGCGLVVVLLLVGAKRHKDASTDLDENIYLSCPAYEKAVSHTPPSSNSGDGDTEECMTSNKLYGKSSTSIAISAALLSSTYNAYDNSVYTRIDSESSESSARNAGCKKKSDGHKKGTESGNEQAGHVYDNPTCCKIEVPMTVNVSYKCKTPSCEEVDNPLYGRTVSNPPPSYSAPRPVLDAHGDETPSPGDTTETPSYENSNKAQSHGHGNETPPQSQGVETPSCSEAALYENGSTIPPHKNSREIPSHTRSGETLPCSHGSEILSYENTSVGETLSHREAYGNGSEMPSKNSSKTPSRGHVSETLSYSEIPSYENSSAYGYNSEGLYYSVPVASMATDTSRPVTAQLAQNLLYESIHVSNEKTPPKKSPPELPPPRKGTSSHDDTDRDRMVVETDSSDELTATYQHLQHKSPSQSSTQQPTRQAAVVHSDYEPLQT